MRDNKIPPMISVNQCTPERVRRTTIATDSRAVDAMAVALKGAERILCSTAISPVHITVMKSIV